MDYTRNRCGIGNNLFYALHVQAVALLIQNKGDNNDNKYVRYDRYRCNHILPDHLLRIL